MDKPQLVAHPDFSHVIELVQEYIRALGEDEFIDDDLDEYIFEAAIEACYGKDIWEYMKRHLQ